MNKYTDLRTDFMVHPVSRDLVLLTDDQAIGNQIKNLMLLNKYESYWDPERGAGLTRLLFENATADTEYLTKNRIREVLQKYVSRAKIVDVVVDISRDHTAAIRIFYQPQNSFETSSVDVIIQRYR